jgi:hypothetical protein
MPDSLKYGGFTIGAAILGWLVGKMTVTPPFLIYIGWIAMVILMAWTGYWIYDFGGYTVAQATAPDKIDCNGPTQTPVSD